MCVVLLCVIVHDSVYYHIVTDDFVIMYIVLSCLVCFFFFQAEDGIRYLVRSRGLGDVYKRQLLSLTRCVEDAPRR